jgi:hypothetical protein
MDALRVRRHGDLQGVIPAGMKAGMIETSG